MKRTHSFSPATVEAARLLGARIQVGRQERRWSVQELADRVGVSRTTMHKIERGDVTVSLGVAFEAAAVVGVPLFDEDRSRRGLELRRFEDRLALLPKRVRKLSKVNDDF